MDVLKIIWSLAKSNFKSFEYFIILISIIYFISIIYTV